MAGNRKSRKEMMADRMDKAIAEHVKEFTAILGLTEKEVTPYCGDIAGAYLVQAGIYCEAFTLSDIVQAVRHNATQKQIVEYKLFTSLAMKLNSLTDDESMKQPLLTMSEWCDDAPHIEIDELISMIKALR